MSDATTSDFELDPSVIKLVNADAFEITERFAYERIVSAYYVLANVLEEDPSKFPDIQLFLIYTYAKMKNADNERLAFVLPVIPDKGQLEHIDIAFTNAQLLPLDGLYECAETVIEMRPHPSDEYGESAGEA